MQQYENKYLINSSPLIVLRELAVILGLNEALVLQQLHYMIRTNKESNNQTYFKEDKFWVRKSYDKWLSDFFPFWSKSTVKRTFDNLEKFNIIFKTNKYNHDNYDNTVWFSIDYDWLDTIIKIEKPISKDDFVKQEEDKQIKIQEEMAKQHMDSLKDNLPSYNQIEYTSSQNETPLVNLDRRFSNCIYDTYQQQNVNKSVDNPTDHLVNLNIPLVNLDIPSSQNDMTVYSTCEEGLVKVNRYNKIYNKSNNNINNNTKTNNLSDVNIWDKTKEELSKDFTITSMNTWINPLKFISGDNNIILLGCNYFNKPIIENRYLDKIEQVILTISGNQYKVKLIEIQEEV